MKCTRNDRIRAKKYGEQNGLCAICAKPMQLRAGDSNGFRNEQAATLDHILPKSLGGTAKQSNLRLVHKHCNRRRGNAPIDAPIVILARAIARHPR